MSEEKWRYDFDNKKRKPRGFMFWEDDRECDLCDKKHQLCASIVDLAGNASIYCDECLQAILNERE